MLVGCSKDVEAVSEDDELAFRVTEAMPSLLTFWSAIVMCEGDGGVTGQGSFRSCLPRSYHVAAGVRRLVLGTLRWGSTYPRWKRGETRHDGCGQAQDSPRVILAEVIVRCTTHTLEKTELS